MWQQLKFRNFKSLREVDLDLERLTVLVGPNGAGKSSVLSGVRHLADLATPTQPGVDAGGLIRQRYAFGAPLGPEQLRTKGTAEEEFIVLGAEIAPGAWNLTKDSIRLRLRPAPSTDADQTPWIELLLNGAEGGLTHTSGPAVENGLSVAKEVARLGHGPAMELSLSAEAMARPSVLEDDVGRLRRDGYGLASLIAVMAATDRTRIDRLEEALRRVVPRALRLRTPPTKVSRGETQIISVNGKDHAVENYRDMPGNRLEIEMKGTGFLDGSMVSDGTLIALGVLALLHSESCPKVVLIDDLDHSLHPSAHKELIGCLRSILAERSELQILCTTHAPYFLDHFEPKEVRVLALDDQGHTHASKLVDHPEWSEALEGLSRSEFWSSVGEQWVTANGNG